MGTTILFRSIAIKNQAGDKFIMLSEVGNSRHFDMWNDKIARVWKEDDFCHTLGYNRWLTREEILDNVASADSHFNSGSYRLYGRRSSTCKADFLRTYKRALNHAKTFAELANMGVVFTFQSGPQNEKYRVDSDAALEFAINQSKALGHHNGYLTHYYISDREFKQIIPSKKRGVGQKEKSNPVILTSGGDFVSKITSRGVYFTPYKHYGKVYELSYAKKLVEKLNNTCKVQFEIVEKNS